MLAQELPGINTVLVAVIPLEADGVLAHRFRLNGARRSLEHRQGAGDRLQRITGLAAVLVALLIAHRAWASVAQEGKAVGALMAVLPLDLHACAGGDVH